jgi:acetolactate synthase-1/2/3 large subunit
MPKPSAKKTKASAARFETTAQAYLELLALRDIQYFFGNAGTDFASIVDAFAERQARGQTVPQPITVLHETPLVAMAHGYYLLSGKPQVAMVHVGAGTANGLGALMAASKGRVPVLFSAGRTPITEAGDPASRRIYIHWGQEAFDQAGMLREYVKWDYELRQPAQLETVIDRALAVAMSEPRGPVYLTLPPEVLAAPFSGESFRSELRYDLPRTQPEPQKIDHAVGLLRQARFPIIITSSLGRTPAAVEALVQLAETAQIGVVSFSPDCMNFPLNHPCHLGFLSHTLIPLADLIVAIETDVPWYPHQIRPQATTPVIQAGVDPLYGSYPIRGFPSDLTLQGDPLLILSEITRALRQNGVEPDRRAAREKRLQEIHAGLIQTLEQSARQASGALPLDTAWVSSRVNRVLGSDTIVVNEYDNAMKEQSRLLAGRYFSSPHAGYLGWGLGAALGAKLARPLDTVIATVGDGSYIFGVPSACHAASAMHQLPLLIIVYNNQDWQAVKRATRALHPDGWAARTGNFPLSDLAPGVRYEKICEAFGGYGECVERPEQLDPALERALQVVRDEKRQALLNIVCKQQVAERKTQSE